MEIIKNIASVLGLIGIGTLVGVFGQHFLDIKKKKIFKTKNSKRIGIAMY